ncbi:hypothetical protein ABIE88_003359 [Bradyrhizobium diazoefficiens]|uniref:hypothetical protein n=1 Tax=Bradyrhizobium diazoefficiens TaxID=1355477 RepID=UPI0035158785
MNPRYLPTTREGKIDRLVEESGEVLLAIGKAARFGLESTHPDGGPNNAARLLSELADLRHAISEVENEITDAAKVRRTGQDLVWTNELIPTDEMRELIGWDGPMDDFLFFQVCAGEWHREGAEWRFYKDPEWD